MISAMIIGGNTVIIKQIGQLVITSFTVLVAVSFRLRIIAQVIFIISNYTSDKGFPFEAPDCLNIDRPS